MMEEAKTVNADEDARFGPGKRRDELPAELACREARGGAVTGAGAPPGEETAGKADKLAGEKARRRWGEGVWGGRVLGAAGRGGPGARNSPVSGRPDIGVPTTASAVSPSAGDFGTVASGACGSFNAPSGNRVSA